MEINARLMLFLQPAAVMSALTLLCKVVGIIVICASCEQQHAHVSNVGSISCANEMNIRSVAKVSR